jgi:hypothetical protein
LEKALERPDIESGPPPFEMATAGRMNARGISVFYGATEANVALAEIRPPVGSRVLIGKFELLRPMRLLDVAALESVFVKGSIFDAGYIRRLEQAKFLGHLSRRITMPVMPDDEPSNYLITQAIADYLAAEVKLDGIIYPSAQAGENAQNVVLFRHAARVREMELPPETEISAQLYQDTEEGRESDYWVWEEVPPPEPPEAGDPNEAPLRRVLQPSISARHADTDGREATLHLALASITCTILLTLSSAQSRTLFDGIARKSVSRRSETEHVARLSVATCGLIVEGTDPDIASLIRARLQSRGLCRLTCARMGKLGDCYVATDKFPTRISFERWHCGFDLCSGVVGLRDERLLQFFRQIDDVRIVLNPDLPAIVRDHSGAVVPELSDPVTFINAGTRTAAVLLVGLVVQQAKASDGERDRTSCDNTTVGYFYDLQPFVLKAGEIVTKDLELLKGYSYLYDIDDNAEIFVICMRFTTVNPDSDEQVKDVPIASQDAGSLNVIWES